MISFLAASSNTYCVAWKYVASSCAILAHTQSDVLGKESGEEGFVLVRRGCS